MHCRAQGQTIKIRFGYAEIALFCPKLSKHRRRALERLKKNCSRSPARDLVVS